MRQADYLVIGGGIMGLAMARQLREREPDASIVIIEKENEVALHASGRNSGVLHAGFYYGADSLKARFCRDGNMLMKSYARAHGLRINECGKVVVAQNEQEREGLYELRRRSDMNGVETYIVDEKKLAEIEPNARTHKEALHSPTTAVVDPGEVCRAVAAELTEKNVTLLLHHPYRQRVKDNTILAGEIEIAAQKIVNCAGLYADRIARDFGFGRDYTIIPFKGVYLRWQGGAAPIRTCIYGVPNLKNPFLGVHFGVRADGTARLGPTAIPAFWRENYRGLEHFNAAEFAAVAGWEAKLLLTNAFDFRQMAFSEIRKYYPSHLRKLAGRMVKNIDMRHFSAWDRPGIRAQLLDKRNLQLMQDFTVEGDGHSVHILNANSPAFTSSFAFAKWVVDEYI